jgi:hypothetical protein
MARTGKLSAVEVTEGEAPAVLHDGGIGNSVFRADAHRVRAVGVTSLKHTDALRRLSG